MPHTLESTINDFTEQPSADLLTDSSALANDYTIVDNIEVIGLWDEST